MEKPNANAIDAVAAGSIRERRPTAALHAAPTPHPTAKPTMAGHVCGARLRAAATSRGSRLKTTAPISIANRVILLVITAVGGAPRSDVCTRVLHRHGGDAEHACGNHYASVWISFSTCRAGDKQHAPPRRRVSVLRFVEVTFDPCADILRPLHLSQTLIEHELGDSGCRCGFRFQNVVLARK